MEGGENDGSSHPSILLEREVGEESRSPTGSDLFPPLEIRK
jgi:hypothetical protein